jgi:hypothetical protein
MRGITLPISLPASSNLLRSSASKSGPAAPGLTPFREIWSTPNTVSSAPMTGADMSFWIIWELSFGSFPSLMRSKMLWCFTFAKLLKHSAVRLSAVRAAIAGLDRGMEPAARSSTGNRNDRFRPSRRSNATEVLLTQNILAISAQTCAAVQSPSLNSSLRDSKWIIERRPRLNSDSSQDSRSRHWRSRH